MSDQPYVVRSVQSTDQGNLYAIGFGALDILDGVEIAGVTPTPPEGFATTSTGDFPILIVYGMAGLQQLQVVHSLCLVIEHSRMKRRSTRN